MDGIFRMLKFSNKYDNYSGKDELRHLYLTDNICIKEQVKAANFLAEQFYYMYKEKRKYADFHLYKDIPLICYMNPFINKINAMVQDDIIEKSWIEELTNYLIFYSKDILQVKIGLILAKEYLNDNDLIDAISAFSKSGEYIFYLMNSIVRLKGFNKFLLELAKRSKGTIKVFAITNMEYLDDDAIRYLVDEGCKDIVYEKLLTNYIFTTVDLNKYINRRINADKLDKFAYLFGNYLRDNDITDIENVSGLIKKYIKIALNIGNSLNVLNSLVLIKEALLDEECNISIDIEEIQRNIESKLYDKKWKDIFETAVIEGKGFSEDVIYLADMYNYKLKLEDLMIYLEKDCMDFPVYYYIAEEGNKEERQELTDYFLNNININNFIGCKEDIEDEELKQSNIGDIILSEVIKGVRDVYPFGKDIAIKCINANINKVRREAIKNLKNYREKLTDEEINQIKEFMANEPNEKIKIDLDDFLFRKEGKTEYVEVEDIVVQEHIQDVYLLSTNVAGVNFRNKNITEKEMDKSDIFYLRHEKNNYYDEKSIIVVSASGYVLGYVSKEENSVLYNLLIRGKYLYALVEEYDLDRDYIKINVYLSYKDVIESINNTLNMISSNKNGEYIN